MMTFTEIIRWVKSIQTKKSKVMVYPGTLDFKGESFNFFTKKNKPNWEFIEGIVEYGTKDRTGGSAFYNFDIGVYAYVLIAQQNYSFPQTGTVVKSWNYQTYLSYQLSKDTFLQELLGEKGALTLEYGYDQESQIESEEITVSGNSFQPLPLEERRVHLVSLAIKKWFGHQWKLDAVIGYASNTLGMNTPVFEADLAFFHRKNQSIYLGFNRELDAKNANNSSTRFLFGVQWSY